MKRATLVLATLALLLGRVGPAKAGFLSPHGEAYIQGPQSGIGFNQTVQGDTTYLANTYSFGNQYSAELSASAISHTDADPAKLLGGRASSEGLVFNNDNNSEADTMASGSWRDVLYLSGPGQLPTAVTFHFTVEGSMAYQFLPTGFGAGSNIEDIFTAGVRAPVTSGFQDGGYSTIVGVVLSANNNNAAFGPGGTNTYGFDSFTGFTMSFDSGLSPDVSASPEPASLTLVAFGGVSLLGYAGLRRGRKVATA